MKFEKKQLAVAVAATVGPAVALADVPADITAAIASLQGSAIALLAAAGAAGVAVLSVGLLWTLGLSIVPKFLKRGARS